MKRIAVCAAALLLLLTAPGFAQVLKPGSLLRVIRTQRFEIIFPAESRQTAETLAGFADQSYETVSALLGIDIRGRIPVVITPHTDQFNGFTAFFPYFRIVLFDTPLDPEEFGFENSLESLFLHELTHAVSMYSRTGFFNGLRSVFGGWVLPTALNAPYFMIEGVTVSFESLEGYGRAVDPLTREMLMQAAWEKRFQTPFQASGAYDLPPGGAYYEYGGLFSKWLQDRYGMEKYAALWQELGGWIRSSWFFYNHGFYSAFKKIYEVPFLDEWAAFEESLRPAYLEDNGAGIVWGTDDSGMRAKHKARIEGAAASADAVYFLDQVGGGVMRYDVATGKTRRFIETDFSAYDVNVSDDDSGLLVSSYRYRGEGDRAEAVVAEYRNGRKRRVWRGLYRGSFFRNGVVGLSSDRHANSLVFRSGPGKKTGGNEETLLRGSAELIFGTPQGLDDTWIAFTALRNGRRELGLYNYRDKTAYRLASDLPDDAERWRYMRYLKYSGGKLLFGYDHDQGMYKLGAVDLRPLAGQDAESAALPVVFAERELSGGVALPVAAGDAVYYRGSFSNWDALARYPEPAAALSGTGAALRLIPWDAPARAAPAIAAAPSGGDIPSRAYLPFKYLNPFRFWLPFSIPTFDMETDNITGLRLGFLSLMTDPTGSNTIVLQTGMNIQDMMAYVSVDWTSRSLGFPVTLHFSDDAVAEEKTTYRETQGNISFSISRGLWNEYNRLTFAAGAGLYFTASDPGDGANIYSWGYDEHLSHIATGLEFSNLKRHVWNTFGEGGYAALYSRFFNLDPVPKIETTTALSFEPLIPAWLRLYAAWDQRGMYLSGNSRRFSGTIFSAIAPSEYSSVASFGPQWLFGGEAELRLFSADIQRNLSHFYFNRIFGTLAYRASLYQPPGTVAEPPGDPLPGGFRMTNTLITRLSLTVSSVYITLLPDSVTPNIYLAWKISNVGNGPPAFEDDFAVGFALSLSL